MTGRSKLKALKAKAKASKEATDKARVESQERRSKRKPPPKVGTEEYEAATYRSRKRVSATHVEAWFRESLFDLYGRKFVIPKWTMKQKTLAKRLLEAYGGDLVREAVDHFFKTWDNMVANSKGKLTGAPTVSLLWGMRERVFADVQNKGRKAGVARKDTDEFREDGDSPDVGW